MLNELDIDLTRRGWLRWKGLIKAFNELISRQGGRFFSAAESINPVILAPILNGLSVEKPEIECKPVNGA